MSRFCQPAIWFCAIFLQRRKVLFSVPPEARVSFHLVVNLAFLWGRGFVAAWCWFSNAVVSGWSSARTLVSLLEDSGSLEAQSKLEAQVVWILGLSQFRLQA